MQWLASANEAGDIDDHCDRSERCDYEGREVKRHVGDVSRCCVQFVALAPPSGPLTPALLRELTSNRIYLDLHTNLYPSGELRGQLINQEAVGVLSGTGGVRGFELVDTSIFRNGFE